jgi:hypothetical protein
MASARASEKRLRRHTHHILILLLALQPRPIVGTVHLDEIEPLHRNGRPVRQVLRQQRAEIWNLACLSMPARAISQAVCAAARGRPAVEGQLARPLRDGLS